MTDSSPQATCWTLVQGAASGQREDRESFARLYGTPMRAYFAARWRCPADHPNVEDAVQEAFLECFREHGALDRLDSERKGGFRAYLYGVLRNIALRISL